MNQKQMLALLMTALVLLIGVAPVAASSATLALGNHTIDGGGAMHSEDGRFALGATIGQPDATALHGDGRFALVGGFWGPRAPVDDETPVPDDGETPVPDDGETPVSDDSETPVPDDGGTPEPDDGETPVPDDGETPEPDDGEMGENIFLPLVNR